MTDEDGPREPDGAGAVASDPGAPERDGRSASTSGSVLVGAVRHGLFGADSWTLRSYAFVGTLAAAFTATLVLLAVPTWTAETAGGGPIQRVGVGFLVLVGLLLVAAAFLPLLLVDRRRRAGRDQRQRAFGLAGWGYLLSLYLALLSTTPPEFQSEPPRAVAPAVEALYALPPVAGIAFPAAAVAAALALEYGLDRPADPGA